MEIVSEEVAPVLIERGFRRGQEPGEGTGPVACLQAGGISEIFGIQERSAMIRPVHVIQT
jgi:hypothetical protein